IHEAGTVETDPKTGAKKFINQTDGDYIRIGGPQGVFMPRAEHEIYKRQMTDTGHGPEAAGGGASGGAAGGPAGAGQDPKQQQAMAILRQNGKPLTPANINYVIQKLGGGQ